MSRTKRPTLGDVITKLKALADPNVREGMERFGITNVKALGISAPKLHALARRIGKNHQLALQLWKSGIHEARSLAGLVDEADKVTEEQMEKWVSEFDSWDICDGVCCYLFDKTKIAYKKAVEWSHREEEFVRRAGFALMAYLAVHDKEASDRAFIRFFPLIKKYSFDERNFVKKAVNWALRQIGKRNVSLNKRAIKLAQEIRMQESRAARWIAADALRELTGEKVQASLRKRGL